MCLPRRLVASLALLVALAASPLAAAALPASSGHEIPVLSPEFSPFYPIVLVNPEEGKLVTGLIEWRELERLKLTGTGRLFSSQAWAVLPSSGELVPEGPLGAILLSVGGCGDGPNWYVYCGNDPVNRVDLWGLAPLKSDLILGSWAHQAIFNQLEATQTLEMQGYYQVRFNREQATIDEKPLGVSVGSRRRPDIAALMDGRRYVWEIKPEGNTKGAAQLKRYIALYAQYADKNPTEFPSGTGKMLFDGPKTTEMVNPYDMKSKITVSYRSDENGMIYYSLDDNGWQERYREKVQTVLKVVAIGVVLSTVGLPSLVGSCPELLGAH
jgi:hypothetical protein